MIDGSYRTMLPPAIVGTGYVVKSLEAALWAVHTTDTFADAVLAAANLGHDADTTAAIAGQLAGAIHGITGDDGIPSDWLAVLHDAHDIARLARELLATDFV